MTECRRVIFLDFDGVVVTRRGPRSKAEADRGRLLPDPALVALLNQIVAATDARVVVSSTWRLGRTVEDLQGLLDDAGFVGRVIDVTPWGVDGRHVERGYEIHDWLSRHPEVDSFVVLDDDSDLGPLTSGRWRVVRGGFDRGMDGTDVVEAVRILRSPLVRTLATGGAA
jgi:hypothetical protein